MGFLMLALALAGHTQAASWEALDFLTLALPPGLMSDPQRPAYHDALTFFTTGTCANYSHVAHYYYNRGLGWVFVLGLSLIHI